MNEANVRLLIVDDHKILRDGLRALLESEENLVVIGEADTGVQAVALATSLRPDLIIMDISLPDMSGLDAIRMIRQLDSSCRIVVLSMYSRSEFVVQALEAGCNGYVPKSATHTSLVEAIAVVMEGECYLHPKAATALVRSRTGTQSEAEKFNQLSEREQEVLRLTVLGFNSREVGEQLILSPKTVDTYRVRAMEKLEIEHRSALIQFALRAGILQGFED
jgi:two-component system, NarL family, response regulator NreC